MSTESRLLVPGSGCAAEWAVGLLRDLGFEAQIRGGPPDLPPDLAWARSGAMALTGWPKGPPRLAPAPLASYADGALRALRALCTERAGLSLDAAALLGERAAALGLGRAGDRSPSGACRLLQAKDGRVALNLARDEDRSLLPAWLGEGDYCDVWPAVSRRVAERAASALVERGRLLGLAIAPVAPPPAQSVRWFDTSRFAAARPTSRASPLVLDLSSLWAGPLCTHLLGLAGARVIKVESTGRPDGARSGPADFFAVLNANKQSIALDLHAPEGVDTLRRLLAAADIVVESARPRALEQLGIDAAQTIRECPGLSWLSITGYGRSEPEGNWIAFGDDAAVAAGLATATGRAEEGPIFCGDAIADPLTGLHASVAALASWRLGGGVLLDLSLCGVVQSTLARTGRCPARSEIARGRDGGWELRIGGVSEPVAEPRLRRAASPARPLGADTQALLRELERC